MKRKLRRGRNFTTVFPKKIKAVQNDALNLVTQKVAGNFGGELAGFAYGRTMIAAEDQYGNYQSTLAGNGIQQAAGSGAMPSYAGDYFGAEPSFTPTSF